MESAFWLTVSGVVCFGLLTSIFQISIAVGAAYGCAIRDLGGSVMNLIL